MGSSPVTATTSPVFAGIATLAGRCGAALSSLGFALPSRGIVAFSGGGDSLALLLALRELLGADALTAVHVDHRLDPGSTRRADAAASLAARLGVRFRLAAAPTRRQTGTARHGLEAWARGARYRLLLAARRAESAAWVATGHHLDDQAETVLLRLARGSGLAGLAGIRPRRGWIVRPLLEVTREHLREALRESGFGDAAIDDPTNRDLRFERNRMRHLLLPRLAAPGDPRDPLAARLGRLAGGVEPALDAIEAALRRQGRLRAGADHRPGHWRLDATALDPATLSIAVAVLRRRGGAAPGRSPRGEAAGERDLGGGWRLEGELSALRLERRRAANPARPFSYTFRAGGAVELPEIESIVSLEPGSVEAWMLRGEAHRAGLALPIAAGEWVTVRSRRPGDRIQPLGSPGRRRLKDVLIDRRVARAERDRLPLLVVRDRVVWVPGVTIDDSCRLAAGGPAWVAQWRRR